MKKRGLPLGFLPGDIDSGSHCMLAYSKPDEAYIQSVVKYMTAGIASGQMCICAVLDPARSLLEQRMKALGISLTSGQLLMPDAGNIYAPGGRFDLRHIVRYWRSNVEIADDKWNGLRAFGDFSSALENRAFRLKTLEYEALINSHMSSSITALCGYQAGILPRGYLLQAKSLHPYIASSKSMRVNRSFCETEKFLAGLYRFQRVGREYPATLDQTNKISSDLEEIAARTGMTMPDIDDLKEAAAGLFSMIVESISSNSARSHVHLVYDPKPEKFTISLRYHRALLDEAPQWSLPMPWKTTDTVHVDESGADTIITMTKRYWAYLNGMESTS